MKSHIDTILNILSPEKIATLNSAFSKLHKGFYKKHSLKQVEKAIGVNIERQSQSNLQNLYTRLRECTELSPAIRNTISQEKSRLTDILTPQELKFYEALLVIPLIGNHATHNAKAIFQSNGYIYSCNQLKKRKIYISTHTDPSYGENHFTFLSYSLPDKISIVNFLAQADIFLVNLDNFSRKEPVVFSGMWSSGHFYAYDREQTAAPVEYKVAAGSTRVYTRYEISFTPQVVYQRHFVFQRPDGVVQQTFSRENEISAGRHIKPYHFLRLIEFVRHLDTDSRKVILENGHNHQLMAKLFGTLFTPGKAELHAPEILHIGTATDTFEFQPWKNKNIDIHILENCIINNDIATLEKYLSKNIPLQFYRLNSSTKEDISLLNLAVIKQRYEMVQLLLEHGADPAHRYHDTAQSLYRGASTRTALQDAVEIKDSVLIKLLCESAHKNDAELSMVLCANVNDLAMYTAIADKLDQTLLHYLLKQYKNARQDLDKLLLVAVFYNHHDAIKLLIQIGANPNNTCKIVQSDDNGHLIPLALEGTALTIAAKHGRSACVQLLLDRGAKPNAYIRKEGTFNKYGKGESPLITCAHGLDRVNKAPRLHGKLEQCRYTQLLNGQLSDYTAIIELLRKSDADLQYITGDSDYFPEILKRFLQEKPDDALQKIYNSLPAEAVNRPIPSHKPGKEYEHESYAIITGTDDHAEPMILLASPKGYQERKEQESDKHWVLPGGKANYQFEDDLTGTLINQTSLQTGLNLAETHTTQHVKRYLNPFAEYDDDDILELSHVNLPLPISTYKLHKNTPENPAIECKRNAYSIATKFKNIQFVALNKIVIEMVNYKNIAFPLCSYQDKPLPYIACIKVAQLCGKKDVDTAAGRELSTQLHYGKWDLFKQTIEQKDLVATQALMRLKITQFTNLSGFITTGMKCAQYNLVNYLLDEGVRLNGYAFNQIIKDYSCPEAIVLSLYEAHKHLFDADSYELLAEYAGKKGDAKLIDALYNHDENLLQKSAARAFRALNLYSLQMILAKTPIQKREFVAKHALSTVYNYDENDNYQAKIDCVQYLLNLCSNYRSPWMLQDISSIYEKVVLEAELKQSLQKSCLNLITFMVKHKHYNEHVDTIYGGYMRLKWSKKNEEAQAYMAVIRNIPIIAIKHAHKIKSTAELDNLLAIYAHDPLLRKAISKNEYLVEISKKDEAGTTCLQRAVNANAIAVVKLLLETCAKHDNFDINIQDASHKTLLENAIGARNLVIAKLLIVHGATIRMEDIILAQQLADKDLLQFIKNRSQHLNKDSGIKIKQPTTLIICSCSPFEQDNLAKTGDVDYAIQLTKAIGQETENLDVHYHRSNNRDALEKLRSGKSPVIFHLLLNAPSTGFGIDKSELHYLKDKGCKIVITSVEFAKYENNDHKRQMLEYFSFADHLIFLDEQDQNSALQIARNTSPALLPKLNRASICAVPPTISCEHIAVEKTDSNIMCFGMLRRGKGFAHVTKLAALLKESDNHLVKNKFIYIVGTVQKHKTRRNGTAYDPSLYKLLNKMYPHFANRFYNKSPQELCDIYQEIKYTPPALPIKLFLDVDENEIKRLFALCEYSFYAAYRGATLRNSSISVSLAYGTIIYSHIGPITPASLNKEGEYSGAMVLFDTNNYESYANNVLEDITNREQNKKDASYSWAKDTIQNNQTRKLAANLVKYELSPSQIAQKHVDIYQQLLENNNTLMKEAAPKEKPSLTRGYAQNGLFIWIPPQATAVTALADVESNTSPCANPLVVA